MDKNKAVATVKRAQEVMDALAKIAIQHDLRADAEKASNLAKDLQEVLTFLRSNQW